MHPACNDHLISHPVMGRHTLDGPQLHNLEPGID